ncbi:MAG: fibronectin type III domain-containing protein, partial [Bdellovibrionota bacterium]
HKMRANGGERVFAVMGKIRRHKGEVRFSVLGKNIRVKAATLVINGHRESDCGGPEPTPTPVPPTASITGAAPSEAITASTGIEIAFAADQPSVNFSCSLDSAPFTTCLSPIIYASLDNGTHSFRVKATNSHGLESPIVSRNWTVDTVAPSVTIADVATPTNLTSFLIPFTSDDVGTYSCVLDGGDPYPCSTPVELLGLGEGDHSLSITATDSLGNRGVSAHVQWQIDLTPPTTTITESHPSASPSTSETRQFVFNASESSSFQCSLDAVAFSDCSSPMLLENLSEGWHRFEIRAIDSTGNVGPVAAATWESDFTAPTLTLGSTVPAAGNTNASNFNVEFASSESSTFLCRLDDSNEETCTSPFAGPFAADGVHSVSIVAVDLAGLRSQAQSVSWSVDSSSPVISFASILPAASARLNTDDMEFVIQTSEPVTLMASFDGGPSEPIAASVLYSNLSEGQHRLSVTGTDSFGNTLNTLVHDFFVDRTVPIVQLAAEITGGTAQTVNSFTFSANEDATFECELDGAGFGGCSGGAMISGLAEGAHEYRVRATDGAGNVSAIASTTWSVDHTAPTTSVTSTQLNATSYRFDFASSETNSTFVCSFDNSPETPCTSPLTMNSLSSGSHSLIVFAVDAIGNRDLAGAQIAVQVEEPVQTFLNNPGIILTNQKQITFTFTSNLANATFLCSLDGAAPTACTSPKSYTNLADGPHTFSVRARSASGVIDPNPKTHSWSVDSASPLILTATTTATTTTITAVWTTNEPATAQVRWGLGGLTNVTAETNFATSHSVVLNGLNPNTVYTIQVTGRDGAGNVYQGPVQSIRTRFF